MSNLGKAIRKYTELYRKALNKSGIPDADRKADAYSLRLTEMYSSEAFQMHNVYPTMNVELVYAVVAMCLELKEYGLTDSEIMAFSDRVFDSRRKAFAILEKVIGMLPNAYKIAEKWNKNDHAKRVADGSITYDTFDVLDGRIEYSISKCMYVGIFEHYGIRGLCKIFCKTDEEAYTNLKRHVKFIRHSDLSDGPACHDEVIRI